MLERLVPDDSPIKPATDERQLVLIVVGSSLRAEEADRPLAYRLLRRIEAWAKRHREQMSVAMAPTICTDLWYINHTELQKRPTICLGGPGVNALSAYFAQHLPDDQKNQPDPRVLIQIDPDFTDLRVCVWGSDHDLTVKGLQLFNRRYLDGFLRAVATQVEPSED
jgi:hypothetical protein